MEQRCKSKDGFKFQFRNEIYTIFKLFGSGWTINGRKNEVIEREVAK